MGRPTGVVRLRARWWIASVIACAFASPAGAIEIGEGLVEIHGAYQMEFRGIADSFELTNFNPHQWAHSMAVEAEFDLLPDGWGPISLLQAFMRVEGRFDCVWQSMCHIATGQRLWGDQANRAPAQFTDGRTSGFSGAVRNPGSPSKKIHGSGARLVGVAAIPPLDAILGIGGAATELALARTLAPVNDVLVAVRHVRGSVAPAVVPLGPWQPIDVKANGALRDIPTGVLTLAGPATIPIPLPFRPDQGSLFSPSARLREVIDDFDDLDVNFRETELQWNRGASQQQVKELREFYFDIDLFDGQLFIRAGRQTTVWGKTELFRAQDQFNPQDIALATLSSLESSRIALWSVRGIWSFWDVGPFQDVRLEVAANVDHFEPTDLGTCGEPFTVWLVCLKKFGALAHGLTGAGLAGEERPQDPWNSTRGLEVGARLEWRWERFSFAITDFYGFPDIPVADVFNEYERNVDPASGRPRIAGATGFGTCVTGGEASCLTPDTAGGFTSGNRQLFDVLCSATSGLAGGLGRSLDPANPPFQADCAIDLFNTTDSILIFPVLDVLAFALGGAGVQWNTLIGPLIALNLGLDPVTEFVPGVPLHFGSGDVGGVVGNETCGSALTAQQQALLGTGPFFHPDLPAASDICRARGIDLYNAEASVLIEAFPQFDGTVASRFVPGMGSLILPGARGPGDPGYDPLVDGCVMDLPDDGGECDSLNPMMGGTPLIDPRTGEIFRSELTALSFNFLALLTTLSRALPDNEECVPTDPLRCSLVTAVFGVAGARRPEVSAGGNGRFGRRDFLWHGGAELRLLYKRRNVLGFSMDFAEDVTKTNWGVEFVWFEDEPYGNTHELDGWSRHDTLTLTVSVDRPTFVNFLNANRTIFFNTQFFIRWIDDYTDKALGPDGPFSLLATFSAFTGFYQDRLLTALTVIHELESNSSGLIVNFTYRMTENFSVSTGLTTFRGEPRSARIPRVQSGLSATAGNDYETRTRFNGLSAVADREELFVTIRYTF